MNKDLTYRQRIARIASVGIVAFVLMWFGVGFGLFEKLNGVDNNTQRVIAFFIVACGAVWLFAIICTMSVWLENWLLEKLKQMEKDA